MKTKKVLLLFIFIISFFNFLFNIYSNSLNITTVRKLESNSEFFKIFSIVVYISYIVFIVMGLFILGLIYCAKGSQESLLIYIYLANNGYLLLCSFTLFFTGHTMVLISSSVSLGICVIGTIIIIISKRNSINKCLYCSSLGMLFGLIVEVWELFLESIQKECSCFYDSSSYCAIAIHYFYTSILGIGLGISMILYIAFLLILVMLWCILKIIVESIIACCDCCKKNNIKYHNNGEINNNNGEINNNNCEINNNNGEINNNNCEINNNNGEINNNNGEINNKNQQENKILTINKPKEALEQDYKNNNSDINNEVKSENETKKYLNNNLNTNNNYQNLKDEINEESDRKLDLNNNINVKDNNV